MTEAEFQRLAAQGFNRVPLLAETFADLETPLSLYLKLANRSSTYLLESVVGGERFGRYSFIGLAAPVRLRAVGRLVTVMDGAAVAEKSQTADPLEFVRQFLSRYRVSELPGLPRFCGGLVGYFGYDVVRWIEPRLSGGWLKPDPVGCPDMLLLVSEELAVIDNLSGKLYLVVYADPAKPRAWQDAQARLRELLGALRLPLSPPSETRDAETEVASNFDADTFRAAVGRAIRYVHDGDIMQVVLSQRLSRPFAGSSLSLYRALRSINPAPYMFYFDFGDFQVVSASPEILVRLERGTVTVRPIAGTRGRDGDCPAHRNDDGRALLARDAHRVKRGRAAAGRAGLRRRVPRGISCGNGKRRAPGTCHGDYRPARAGQAGRLRGCCRLSGIQRRYGPGHCDPHGCGERGPDARAGGRRDRRRLGARERIAGNPSEGARGAASCRDRLERDGQAGMILMIDNYDSFTWNLVQYLGELGADVEVFRNDEIAVADIAAMKPKGIVISPGPCTPTEAGISLAAVHEFSGLIPILGVCLGHQAIGQAFGGEVVHAGKVVHGKTSTISHFGLGVFRGLPSPFRATRYHSLAIRRATLPKCLEVTAESEDGEIMGVRHREFAVEGVQFHPESFLTEHGHALLKNFLQREAA